ncbi:MmgE/PrpD family protein [Pseudooceanicola sp. MF1-13]|uniref:MmgE/PrpD family protein n=1 Tax=Pseudooceanicola sp. MF1-13 TaxID=3379095 RepID=UPI003892814B
MGATAAMVGFGCDTGDLPGGVERAAIRHLIDTIGVIVAGLGQGVAATLAPLQPEGDLPLPGHPGTRAAADHAYLCGTAAHGLELDDGYREGSVHPGVAVVPALLSATLMQRVSGRDVLHALAVGYESVCALSAALHPALRDRGFHPTSTVGPMGSAMAVARVLGLDPAQTEAALGFAASEAGGLFAFLGGGGEVKRLHGGLAARGGLMAARLAASGISAPYGILERPSGYAQAFGGIAPGEFSLTFPPDRPWRMTDCYIKPHACCRHLQPALEALIALRATHDLHPDEVTAIEVETYSIAAAHADTGWGDMATAQLSFQYVLAQGLWKGRAALADFDDTARAEPFAGALLPRLTIRASDAMDALYPDQRPARVTVMACGERYSEFALEASGSPQIPVSDQAIGDKFLGLTAPVVGDDRARDWLDQLWDIATANDAGRVMVGAV